LLKALLGLLERRWLCGDVLFFASSRWNGTFATAPKQPLQRQYVDLFLFQSLNVFYSKCTETWNVNIASKTLFQLL